MDVTRVEQLCDELCGTLSQVDVSRLDTRQLEKFARSVAEICDMTDALEAAIATRAIQ